MLPLFWQTVTFKLASWRQHVLITILTRAFLLRKANTDKVRGCLIGLERPADHIVFLESNLLNKHQRY
jgi:hypothetical protein